MTTGLLPIKTEISRPQSLKILRLLSMLMLPSHSLLFKETPSLVVMVNVPPLLVVTVADLKKDHGSLETILPIQVNMAGWFLTHQAVQDVLVPPISLLTTLELVLFNISPHHLLLFTISFHLII